MEAELREVSTRDPHGPALSPIRPGVGNPGLRFVGVVAVCHPGTVTVPGMRTE